MSAQQAVSVDLWDALARHGIMADAFDFRGQLQTDCPYCVSEKTMLLNRSTYRAKCTHCHVDARLAQFVEQLDQRSSGGFELAAEDEIELERPERQQKTAQELAMEDQARAEAATHQRELLRLEAESRIEAARLAKSQRAGKLGERIIITLLALVFLGAGLAAAALSGFANFQAFSASVTDPVQGRIWGWSGVIASVCSFGGFTFFWWHASAKRFQEAFRALVFALAGAGTSIAGTAMFMDQNEGVRRAEMAQAAQASEIISAEIADWTRQLEGIPAGTRSVDGLEQYLLGVEAAGRTHQKPYRDGQNELGLAKRRDRLERQIAEARADLRSRSDDGVSVALQQSIPALFFAVMLEVFSSQGTSIAFVSLLLLYGRRAAAPISPVGQPGPDSLSQADQVPA